MEDVSLRYFGSYQEIRGHQPTIPQGYEKLAQCLADTIPDENILLNHRVTQIDWKQQRSGGDILVTCDNNALITAESVVITLPLGVLKSQSKALFKPSLPDKKKKAIRRLGTDAVDKVFLFYDDLEFMPLDVCKIHIARSRPAKNDGDKHWTQKIHSFHLERNPNQHIIVCKLLNIIFHI